MVLEKITNEISREGGDTPLVFLDTGAVLHFEKILKQNRSKFPGYNSDQLYAPILDRFRTYVTETAMSEICQHHEKHIINGRPEISDDTFKLMGSLHGSYCRFLKEIMTNPISLDNVRYDVFNAGNLAHLLRSRDHPKKTDKPGLSFTDREILETAGWLRYATFGEKNFVTSTIVLTSESLMRSAAKILCDQNPRAIEEFGTFGYDKIKVIKVDDFSNDR